MLTKVHERFMNVMIALAQSQVEQNFILLVSFLEAILVVIVIVFLVIPLNDYIANLQVTEKRQTATNSSAVIST